MSERIQEITDDRFDSDVLESTQPAVVDFWAPWCGPCKAIGPTLDALAESYGDRIRFFKCNVDDNPSIPGRYGVKSIPTLMFFDQGKLVDQIVGMTAKGKIEDVLKGLSSGSHEGNPFVMS